MGSEFDQNIVSSERRAGGVAIDDVEGDRGGPTDLKLGPLGFGSSDRRNSMAGFHQSRDGVRADHSRGAGKEYLHDCWPCYRSGYSVKKRRIAVENKIMWWRLAWLVVQLGEVGSLQAR
jgi:hypothetical protein